MRRRRVEYALDHATHASGRQARLARRRHPLRDAAVREMARERHARDAAGVALLGERERRERPREGSHAQLDDARTCRDVAGPDDLDRDLGSHPGEERREDVPHVVRRRREILEYAARDAGRERRLREAGEREDAEREHRRGSSGADVPRERPASDAGAGDERELLRADGDPAGVAAAELRAGTHGGEMLRAQSRLGTARACVCHMQREAAERGESDREPNHRAGAGALGAVHVEHEIPTIIRLRSRGTPARRRRAPRDSQHPERLRRADMLNPAISRRYGGRPGCRRW